MAIELHCFIIIYTQRRILRIKMHSREFFYAMLQLKVFLKELTFKILI